MLMLITYSNIKELTNILEKNQFPSHLVKNIVKQYLYKFFTYTSRASTVTSPNDTSTHYYNKLPFVGPFSSIAQRWITLLTQRFCNNLDNKLVFAPYKIKNLFSVKDAIPKNYDLV
jgi:GTP-sensing pleiotropic transcriptional regulator CodY